MKRREATSLLLAMKPGKWASCPIEKGGPHGESGGLSGREETGQGSKLVPIRPIVAEEQTASAAFNAQPSHSMCALVLARRIAVQDTGQKANCFRERLRFVDIQYCVDKGYVDLLDDR